jgi:Flp pilus assembly protein TadD
VWGRSPCFKQIARRQAHYSRSGARADPKDDDPDPSPKLTGTAGDFQKAAELSDIREHKANFLAALAGIQARLGQVDQAAQSYDQAIAIALIRTCAPPARRRAMSSGGLPRLARQLLH